jgi:hypothetical protein
MALVKCEDCGSDISSRAPACVKCGRPRDLPVTDGSWRSAWSAVARTRTPINVFALAMMACAAVFGFSATLLKQDPLPAFTYSLHTFLAIAGMFFVTLLFCRGAIYPPSELARAKEREVDLGRDRPVLAALLLGAMFIAYGLYQGFVASEQLKSPAAPSAREKP